MRWIRLGWLLDLREEPLGQVGALQATPCAQRFRGAAATATTYSVGLPFCTTDVLIIPRSAIPDPR